MIKKVCRIASVLFLLLLSSYIAIGMKEEKKDTSNLSIEKSKIGELPSKESEIRNTSERPTEMWGADIVAERGHWNRNLAANEQYIFYVNKKQIIRLDRVSKKKKVIYQHDKQIDIKLCLDDKFLYYLIDEKNIYRVDFDGKNTNKVVSLKMLQRKDFKIPSISGMRIFDNKLYLYEKIYGYIVEFIPEENETRLIAKCVHEAEFCNHSLYYVDEDKRCIYSVDLNEWVRRRLL